MTKLGKLPFLAMCLYLFVCAAHPAAAQDSISKQNATISEIVKMLDDMGYTVMKKDTDLPYVEIKGYNVVFAMSDNNTNIFLIIPYAVDHKYKAKLPKQRYLEFNADNHTYTYVKFDEKGASIEEGVHAQLTASALTPKSLRATIDDIVSSADSLPVDPARW